MRRQATIDLAMYLVRQRGLGIPQDSRDAFSFLIEASLLDPVLGDNLKRMVGFRNVAIHDYQKLNLDLVKHILENRLDDFSQFAAAVLKSRGYLF